MGADRVHRLRLRHWIGSQDSQTVIVPRAADRRSGRWILAEATGSAAVRGARDVVPPHVFRQRYVLSGVGSHPLDPQLQRPDLRGAEMLDDLRAGTALSASIEDAPRGQMANMIFVPHPPLRAFAAGLV